MTSRPLKALLHLPVLILVLSNCVAYSQSKENKKKQKVEIVHANSLRFIEGKKKGARVLKGEVEFKQGEVHMFCDSAYFYAKENTLDAYSNVRIKQGDTLNLYGDSLHYDGDEKLAQLRGDIKLIDKEIELYTSYLDYNLTDEMGFYTGGGKIISKKEEQTLTSKVGYYYPKSKQFFFKDSVRLVNPEYTILSDSLVYYPEQELTNFAGPTWIKSEKSTIYCEAGWYDANNQRSLFRQRAKMNTEGQELSGDSILYNNAKGIGEGFGNVTMIDTAERMTINGDYAYHHEQDSITLIVGHLLLTQVFDEDTLYLHADTLYATYDSLQNRILKAFYHVKFFKENMQGMTDSLIFSDADSTIKLFHAPVVWSDENQITADYIEILRTDGKIKSMDMINNSFIISQEDSTSFNQIKGKNMYGKFSDNELKKVDVKGNGQTIYFAKEENGSLIGMNKVVCTNMIIKMDSNTVKDITFLTQPSATLLPPTQVKKKDKVLQGFVWKEALRPARKEDVFIWETKKKTSKIQSN